MRGYDPTMSFDENAVAVFGEGSGARGDEGPAVAFLASHARGGRALELGIGSGRIALPLAATGVRVDGIDITPTIVEELRARPGGADIAVTMGSFADVAVDGTYELIYVVFNTFFNLLTQDDQVRCFENVAARLTDTGVFVMETYVPTAFVGMREDQYVEARAIETDRVRFDVLMHDGATQMLDESHVLLSREHGVQLVPVVQRYAWPAELDLMARIAGLRLHERWGGWHRQPFRSSSALHVSVWGR